MEVDIIGPIYAILSPGLDQVKYRRTFGNEGTSTSWKQRQEIKVVGRYFRGICKYDSLAWTLNIQQREK